MTAVLDPKVRARPLAEVKAEIVRRGGHMNPLDDIKPEDAAGVAQALTSLDRDEWAREWSKLGNRYEAEADALARSGGDGSKLASLYLLAFNYFRIARYPCPTTAGTQQAYGHSLRNFRKAAKHFDLEMQLPLLGVEL